MSALRTRTQEINAEYWAARETQTERLVVAQIALAFARTEQAAGLDVDRLAQAITAALDNKRVQCRCGKWPLLDNWSNHRLRRDGRPHRPVFVEAARGIAAEYARRATTPVSDDTEGAG